MWGSGHQITGCSGNSLSSVRRDIVWFLFVCSLDALRVVQCIVVQSKRSLFCSGPFVGLCCVTLCIQMTKISAPAQSLWQGLRLFFGTTPDLGLTGSSAALDPFQWEPGHGWDPYGSLCCNFVNLPYRFRGCPARRPRRDANRPGAGNDCPALNLGM